MADLHNKSCPNSFLDMKNTHTYIYTHTFMLLIPESKPSIYFREPESCGFGMSPEMASLMVTTATASRPQYWRVFLQRIIRIWFCTQTWKQ